MELNLFLWVQGRHSNFSGVISENELADSKSHWTKSGLTLKQFSKQNLGQ